MSKFVYKLVLATTLLLLSIGAANSQTYKADMERDSARSDKLTGGRIEKSNIAAGDGNLRLTLNVPSFVLNIWQDKKEIRKYHVGVGMAEYPIFVSIKSFKEVIFNPSWFPPYSEWVDAKLRGTEVKANNPLNPLGKVKIPIGNNFLLHQAKGPGDLGNLVSHGCVRVMLADLYDVNDVLIEAYAIDVNAKKLANAKRSKNLFTVSLPESVPIEVTYDTVVIEDNVLHIYPDVYNYKPNYAMELRNELKSNQIDDADFSDEDLRRLYGKVEGKRQFVIGVADLKAKRFGKGKLISVVSKK